MISVRSSTRPIITGVVVGVLSIAMLFPLSASAAGNDHRVIVGIATTSANFFTWGWHTPGSNLDLNTGAGTTAGKSVYWQSKHIAGTKGMNATTIDHPGYCTGQDVYVTDGSNGTALGNYWFVHISPAGSGTWFWVAPSASWTIQYMGSILLNESNPCTSRGLWDGPHLHQGGDNAASTAVVTNWGIISANPISPTGDAVNKWMHKYSW